MKYFDENIIALIDLLAYDMYLISQDKHINCICQDFNTKQGKPDCPHCFGTGHKVKIKKIQGVRQPLDQNASKMNLDVETGVYFFKKDYKIKEDDYLVWHNEIEQVTKLERHCSDAQLPVYFRCETKRKKTNLEVFLKNFCKIIGKKYERR